jgi:ribosomal protein S17
MNFPCFCDVECKLTCSVIDRRQKLLLTLQRFVLKASEFKQKGNAYSERINDLIRIADTRPIYSDKFLF